MIGLNLTNPYAAMGMNFNLLIYFQLNIKTLNMICTVTYYSESPKCYIYLLNTSYSTNTMLSWTFLGRYRTLITLLS